MALSWQELQEYCKHPKDDLFAFKIVRHSMTILSICVTPLSVYIVKKSPAVTRIYANLLVVLLVECVTVDVLLQWVADPTFILPLMCIYRKAPLIKIPISAAASMGLAQSFVFGVFPVYFALFIYRHQTLVLPGSRFKFSDMSLTIFLAILMIPYLLIGVSFAIFAVPLSKYSLRKRLSDNWAVDITDRMDCFETLDMLTYYFLLFFEVSFAIIFITMVARHTFLLLREVKHLSAKTHQLCRILTKALVVQALTPVVIFLVPLGLTLISNMILTTFWPAVMSTWPVEPLDFVIAAGSLHASTHSIALILTTPAFRTQLLQMLPRRAERITMHAIASSQRSFTV